MIKNAFTLSDFEKFGSFAKAGLKAMKIAIEEME